MGGIGDQYRVSLNTTAPQFTEIYILKGQLITVYTLKTDCVFDTIYPVIMVPESTSPC